MDPFPIVLLGSEDVIDRDAPAGNRRLCLGSLSPTIGARIVRVGGSIDVYAFCKWIDIPNYLSASHKIIGSLFGQPLFRSLAIVELTANFDRQIGRAFNEAHSV